MSGIAYDDPNDRPYGPTNPDYEFDGRDMEMSFPEDPVLIARGKYSTLASERREALKKLRDDMEAIAGYASRILRTVTDREFAGEQFTSAEGRFSRAKEMLSTIAELDAQISELRPVAWGAKGEQE